MNVSAKSVLHMKHPQISEIGTGKICDWSREKKRELENNNLSGDSVQ